MGKGSKKERLGGGGSIISISISSSIKFPWYHRSAAYGAHLTRKTSGETLCHNIVIQISPGLLSIALHSGK